jgi:hypothetical protein
MLNAQESPTAAFQPLLIRASPGQENIAPAGFSGKIVVDSTLHALCALFNIGKKAMLRDNKTGASDGGSNKTAPHSSG